MTGWTGTAVAMFELLSWNQNLNHLRMLASGDDPSHRHPFALDRVGTVDLRDRDVLDRVDGAFDEITHTVDVRPIGDAEGWYGIRKVCFFVFRLTAFPLAAMTPAPSATGGSGCFHVHPLGQDAPVFHVGTPVPDDELADEDNVDAPIRPYGFYLHPELDWNVRLAIHHGPNGDTVPVDDDPLQGPQRLAAGARGQGRRRRPHRPDSHRRERRARRPGHRRRPRTASARRSAAGPTRAIRFHSAPNEIVLDVQRGGGGTTFASPADALAHWIDARALRRRGS